MFIFFFNNRPKERIFTTMDVTGAPDLADDDTISYRLESSAGELYSFNIPFSDFTNGDIHGGRTTYKYKQNKLTIVFRIFNGDPADIRVSIKDMDAGMNRENYSDTLTLTMSMGDTEGSVVVYLVEGNQVNIAELNVEGEINTASVYGTFRLQTDIGFSGEIPPLVVQDIDLGNYPNPFNGRTMIRFSIPVGGNVDIKVFDVLGRQVSDVYSGYLATGNHEYTWPGDYERNPRSGIYYYRLIYAGESRTGKMMYLK
jgi:hypothetical protein